MSNQVQCPNCGGYKVGVKNKNIIASEKQEQPVGFMTILFGWIIAGYSVFCFIGSIVEHRGFFAIACSGLVALLFVSAMLYRAVKRGWTIPVTVPTLVKYDFECDICGYSWTWQTDQPHPYVQVRPELIAKGKQKLAEEEQKRRKQQEAIEALYYLTHQGKK